MCTGCCLARENFEIDRLIANCELRIASMVLRHQRTTNGEWTFVRESASAPVTFEGLPDTLIPKRFAASRD